MDMRTHISTQRKIYKMKCFINGHFLVLINRFEVLRVTSNLGKIMLAIRRRYDSRSPNYDSAPHL